MYVIENARKMKIIFKVLLTILPIFPLSCGVGTGPDPQRGSGKGNVAIFFTDNISFYKQVVSTITGVHLVNSGTGDVCKVMTDPLTLDIANLTNLAHYAGLAECHDGRYNRVDIEFRKEVVLMDNLDATSACSFLSYIDANGTVKPLACDQNTGICSLSIRGGLRDGSVTVQEDRYNDLGIDFDLKQFIVEDFGNPATCSVTMTASVVSAVDMNSSGRAQEVTGPIGDIALGAHTFTLLAGGVSLTVDYAAIVPALQRNIDDLLLKAQSDGLSVIVQTGGIDIETGVIEANRIYVKTAGTVSGVQALPEWSFVIAYEPAKTIAGSYKPPAVVEGAFVDGAWVNVRFDGYDTANAKFLAASVEVLPAGTVIND